MVRALPALLLLFCTACGLAEDGRDEDNKYIYIKFYDKAFEAYCLEKFDTSGDGRISRYEAQRVRRMSCPGLGIGSLTDIREFFNLRELDCSGNELTQLDLTALHLPRTARLLGQRPRIARSRRRAGIGVDGLQRQRPAAPRSAFGRFAADARLPGEMPSRRSTWLRATPTCRPTCAAIPT